MGVDKIILQMELNHLKGKYWHELDDDQYNTIFQKGVTVKWVLDNIKQPDWCKYTEALTPMLGCWSLTDKKLRKQITQEYCKSCDLYKKRKSI